MGDEKRHHPDDPNDYRRARILLALLLGGVLGAGILVNGATRSDTFNVFEQIACLTAICALVGLNRVRFGGM